MENPKTRIRCDQCELAAINGVICHEQGCPNQNKIWDFSQGVWREPDEEIEDDYYPEGPAE